MIVFGRGGLLFAAVIAVDRGKKAVLRTVHVGVAVQVGVLMEVDPIDVSRSRMDRPPALLSWNTSEVAGEKEVDRLSYQHHNI